MSSRLLVGLVWVLTGSGCSPPSSELADLADLPDLAPEPARDPVRFTSLSAVLKSARKRHTATRLNTGEVLIAGGEDTNATMLSSVEIFDPSSGSFRVLSPMPSGRSNHTATLLPSGQVLIVGGGETSPFGTPAGVGLLATALLYDPMTERFSPTGSLATARSNHTATAFRDGRVVVIGGTKSPPQTPQGGALATDTAELYDPASGLFTVVGRLATARDSHGAALLPSDEVLVVAGADDQTSFATAEIFDPKTTTFRKTGSLEGDDRLFHSTQVLSSGEVLVAGGKKSNAFFLKSTELYDPSTQSWRRSGELSAPRTGASLVLLASGRAIVTGGYNLSGRLDKVELFDPATVSWSAIAPLTWPRTLHSATLLRDNSVLIVGGSGDMGDVLATAELSRTE